LDETPRRPEPQACDVAAALLQYARSNNVSLMILGATTHGLKLQRVISTVPVRVAMDAPCSVMLVKQALPFEQLGRDTPAQPHPAATMGHVVAPL